MRHTKSLFVVLTLLVFAASAHAAVSFQKNLTVRHVSAEELQSLAAGSSRTQPAAASATDQEYLLGDGPGRDEGQVSLDESFETGAGFFVQGWWRYSLETPALASNASLWSRASAQPHTGTWSSRVLNVASSGAVNNDWMVTRMVHPVAGHDTFSFWYRQSNAPGTQRDTLTAWAGTSPDPATMTQIGGPYAVSNVYSQAVVSLAAYHGQNIYLAIKDVGHMTGTATVYCYVDDVLGPSYPDNDMCVYEVTLPLTNFMKASDGVVTIPLSMVVRNMGALEATNYTVACTLKTGGTPVAGMAQTIAGPATQGGYYTVTLGSFTGVTPGQYTFEFTATIAGDAQPSNDRKIVDLIVVNNGNERKYDNGVLSTSTAYSNAGNGWGLKYTPTAYPAVVLGAEVGLADYQYPALFSVGTPYPYRIRIVDDDGTGGAPLTTLWESGDQNPDRSYVGKSYYTPLATPQVITSGGYYVFYVQMTDMNLCPGFGMDAALSAPTGTYWQWNSTTGYAQPTFTPTNDWMVRGIDGQYDAGVVSIDTPAPDGVLAPGTQITPAVTVVNGGSIPEAIPVTFALSGGPTAYSDLETTGSVAPGATASQSFVQSAALAAGYYTMTATTSLSGDAVQGNNEAAGHFLVIGAPTLESPVSGYVNTGTPTFQWADLAGAATYDIQVDNNSDFSSPEYSATGLAVSQAIPGTAIPDGHYYWRVLGWNQLFGPWSAVAEFDIDANAPGQVTLLTPANHADPVGLLPTFTWTAVTFDGKSGSVKGLTDAAPVAYRIQVATDDGFLNIVIDQSGLSSETYTSGSMLTYGTQYFWHVQASDGAGNIGQWSSTFDFTTVLQMPDAPALLLPPAGATDVAVDGDLTWSAAAHATAYDVYLDVASPPLSKIGSDVTVLAQAYSGLVNSQTYYWQVVAKNNAGDVASVIRSFTTIIAAPIAPVLVSPADLAVDVVVAGAVRWEAAARAAAYDVYLDVADPPMTLLAGDVTGTLQVYSGLAVNQVYYWQVKSKNVGGTALSEVWSFTTGSRISYPRGWYPWTPVPVGILVKDGGAMACNADNKLIYEMKGNKTLEFNSYNPAESAWTLLAPIPSGLKPVKSGASMATGAGKVFVTKGNNTLEFYRYDIATGAWLPATVTVPLGAGKKVKAGGSMAFVAKPEGDFVYLLKGYGTEFYKYDVARDSFSVLASAPNGIKPKYDKGSWIAYDGGQYIYCYKSKYGFSGSEFYKYDVQAEAWLATPMLPTMMLVDPLMGKKKKVGDGSCAAWGDGALYALKGNNNNTFWKYTPTDSAGTWAELETMPQVALPGDRKKKVKAGGAIVYYPEYDVLFAQKGNKVNQFWMYSPGPEAVSGLQPGRDGVALSGRPAAGDHRLSISPNPLATGCAVLRYSLPRPGPVSVNVFDVTGRSVFSQRTAGGRASSLSVDLSKLMSGVYLVSVSSDGYHATRKLVVER